MIKILKEGKDPNTTTGHECECGDVQKYPAYVFAHYDTELSIECPGCKRVILLKNGRVWYKP